MKSVFQVIDFISLERHPKADWEAILTEARHKLGEAERTSASHENREAARDDQPDADYMEIRVFIQQLKGIPMQIKLVKGETELRVGLPDRFRQAVLDVQEAVSNLIFERKWVEQKPRYGSLEQSFGARRRD